MSRRVLCLIAAALFAACSGTATPVPSSAPSTPGGPSTPGAVATPRITAEPEPSEPATSQQPAETPSSEEAYQQLLAAIPPSIASRCKQFHYTQTFAAEPGEYAEADCTLGSGSLAAYVTYKLFDGADSMNTYFDIQRKGHENAGTTKGPGCGSGPGEGTWDNGRKDCFQFVTHDAQVMWTHDQLYVSANANRDDADWATLEQFWQTAGPVAP